MPDSPEEQAKNRPSPVNGQAPPVEHQWQPGQSGNPGGRPKGRTLTARLRELLQAQATDRFGKPIEGKTWLDVVAEALIREAASGEVKAVKELVDRTEGKARPAPDEDQHSDARDYLLDEALRIVREKPRVPPG